MKSWPNLYSNWPYEIGHDFLNIQQYNLHIVHGSNIVQIGTVDEPFNHLVHPLTDPKHFFLIWLNQFINKRFLVYLQ